MKSKKSNSLIFFLFTIITILFCGCLEMEGTTNSSPGLTEDYSKLRDEIKGMSNSESVALEDFETKRGDKIVKRELRIDLTKPNPFPNEIKIREIIFAVKSKLVDSTKYDTYTVTEVPRQEGDTISVPAEKILKSVTIMAKDL